MINSFLSLPFVLSVLVLAQVLPAKAQLMNYQGRLTDPAGLPLPDNQYTLEFSLWTAATGGTMVWGPFTLDGTSSVGKGPQADLVNGRFNSILGPRDTANRLLTTAFSTESRFLQIKVGTNAAITPRQMLLDAPSAISALTAQTTDLAKRLPNVWAASGNLGIGVENPLFPLSFVSGTGDKISLSGLTGPHFGFGIQPGVLQIHADTATSSIAFGSGTSAAFAETMRLTGNGNLGLGTSGPLAKLEIRGGNDANVSTIASFAFAHQSGGFRHFISSRHQGGSDSGNALDFWINKRNQEGGTSQAPSLGNVRALTLTDAGVGVGTATPQSALEVVAPTFAQLRLTHNAANSWTIGANNNNTLVFAAAGSTPGMGGYIDGGSGSYISQSDRRLKKDIENLGPVLDKAMKLRPVSYHFKVNPANAPRSIGFIAQEAAEIFPDTVSEQGGFLALSYSSFIPVAFGAIQELKQELDRAGDAIRSLSGRNENLVSEARKAETRQLALTTENASLTARLVLQEASARTLQVRMEKIEKSLAALATADSTKEPLASSRVAAK